jgi:hypothetical protein
MVHCTMPRTDRPCGDGCCRNETASCVFLANMQVANEHFLAFISSVSDQNIYNRNLRRGIGCPS